MSTKKETYELFIIDLLKQGIVERKDIMAKFVKVWQMPTRTFDRYLKTAQERHSAEREAIENEKAKEYKEIEIQAFKSKILQSNEKKEILSAIIRGECVVDDILADKGEVIPYKRPANARERIEAIKVLNAMDGDNAPKEIKNSHEIKEMPSVQEWILSKSNKID